MYEKQNQLAKGAESSERTIQLDPNVEVPRPICCTAGTLESRLAREFHLAAEMVRAGRERASWGLPYCPPEGLEGHHRQDQVSVEVHGSRLRLWVTGERDWKKSQGSTIPGGFRERPTPIAIR